MTDEERIDKVLNRCAEEYPAQIYISMLFAKELCDTDQGAYYRIIERIETEGLAKKLMGDRIWLEPHGQQIVSNGGYLAHLEREKLKAVQEEKKQELVFEKTKYELLNNKWLYKTRWWPLIISILAILMAVMALLKENN